MYKLRATLTGHELDVRGVTAISNDTIVSGSRDGTARLWDLQYKLDTLSNGEICFTSPTSSFVNAVEHVPLGEEPLVAVGGKDAVVYLTDIHDSFAKPGDDFGKYQLVGHQGNVCSLNYNGGYLVSGSWDCRAKVWDLATFTVKYDLVGHSASVWDVQVVDAEQDIFLTCSADRTIRKWQGDKEIGRFQGHNDVIRKLLVLPGGDKFVSASNDCTLKVWDLHSGHVLQTLHGHDSFVYDLALLSNGDIVSTAEDRTVRIWHDGAVQQAITLPCISVWSVAVLPNDDIAVGGSDKQIYVFTQNEERVATESALRQFKEQVEASAISEQSLDDLKKTDIPGYDRLQQPGKEEGSTIMVKSPVGVIEAHQWTGGEWVKIGDVVNSAGGSTGKKEHNGVEYDYVFDVDVEDGKPPLKLPYNANENPYAAADRFLAANDLPSLYTEEVVKFINQNTSGFQLDQQSGPAGLNEAQSGQQSQGKEQKAKDSAHTKSSGFFPQTGLVTFGDFKAEQLVKGFKKFNLTKSEDLAFSKADEKQVEDSLAELKSKLALWLINSVVPKILEKWPASEKLLGFDLLRISIPRVSNIDLLLSTESAETIVKLLLQTLEEIEEKDLALLMMISRVLCGLTASTLFAQLFLTVDDKNVVLFNSYFAEVVEKSSVVIKIVTTSETSRANKHFKNALSAFASFVFDLSAYPFTNKSLKLGTEAISQISAFLDETAEDIVREDEEAAYRLIVAFGNLKTAGIYTGVPEWVSATQKLHTTARFQEIYTQLR